MKDGPEYIELSNMEGGLSIDVDNQTPELKSSSLTEDQTRLVLLRLGVISDDKYRLKILVNNIDIPSGAHYMIDKISELPIEDAITILRDSLVEHNGDVNFLLEDYRLIERLIRMAPSDPQITITKDENEPGEELPDYSNFKNKTYLNIIDWNLQVRLEASLIAYHSPYPEVRAITDPFDDPNTPVETFRVYVISLCWTVVGSIVNTFFVHRMPSIVLGSHTIQLLLLPCGKLWERSFPMNKIVRVLGYEFNINPGPWTYKEMMLASIIYGCSSGLPYAIYNIVVMKLEKFYDLKWVTLTYQVLLVFSTQFLGFGFAGVMRKVCVYPVKSLWPAILPTLALNRALIEQNESKQPIYGWTITRYSFFCLIFTFSFFYTWIPSVFFKALSTFNWPTWFNPNLLLLANITGSNIGLGLNPIPSFDWNILDAAGCLTVPFYTYANQYFGSILAFFVILGVYYTNNKWTGYLPINSNELFNNKGDVYNVHDILNEKNHFDAEKYKKVGPPYFTAASLIVYGSHFAIYPFAIVYHIIDEWNSMKTAFKNVAMTLFESFSFKSKSVFGSFSKDPHCRMMHAYDEVPDWWFTMILVASTGLGIVCVLIYPSETPVWGILFTILINFIFLIPLTAIASVTGFSFGLNVLVELIVGYAIPNSGLALITLKSYGTNIDHQAANYITDQKLAHYAKIPPKAIFRGQLVSTFISIIIAITITNWQIANVEDLCERHQPSKLTCPGANTYFYSSIQYGVIGPAKVFSGLYPVLKWCFLLGFLLVFPCLLFKYYGPKSITRYYNPTIIMGGFTLFAPYNLLYYTGGFYLSYLFMYYIKKNYSLWWEKYNYILTTALSAGIAFSALVIFFTIKYDNIELNWWGNQVSNYGIEGYNGQMSWLSASDAPEGYFGLRESEFP